MLLRLLALTLAITGANAYVAPACLTTKKVTALCATSDRREFSACAASALVGISLTPLPAFAAKKGAGGCLAGTNPASGYTVGVFEHSTPDFKKWHKVLDGFGKDLLSVYPPECKVIREVRHSESISEEFVFVINAIIITEIIPGLCEDLHRRRRLRPRLPRIREFWPKGRDRLLRREEVSYHQEWTRRGMDYWEMACELLHSFSLPRQGGEVCLEKSRGKF